MRRPKTSTAEKSGESLADLFRSAFLIRAAEQKLLDLFAQGKLFGTVHTCIGQELAAAAVMGRLLKEDLVFSNHRCHGHFLARSGNVVGLLAEIMGREAGVCGGRGGSQHLCHEGFFSNGVLGSTAPVAAGLAAALKFGEKKSIAVACIGDGTLGEGVLYETFNIASKWELPLLFVLENNRYAQSTSQEQTLAGGIEERAAAFGISTACADVWNPEALCVAAEKAVAAVREKRKPFFLRIDCDRLMSHSKGDDNRPKEEIARYWQRDPLTVFAQKHPDDAKKMQTAASAAVEVAYVKAEASPAPKARASDEDANPYSPVEFRPHSNAAGERVAARLYASFKKNLGKYSDLLFIGEDIEGAYGGAFKVTKTLSSEFPGRVRNTPISEGAITGLANGLALGGYRTVVEYMFGDFLALAADQIINSAAKFRYMFNNQVRVPIVLRTPMGGRRGYGPTHSQSLEKHFLGIPGTQVLALNAVHDPAALYDALLSGLDKPTIVIENKLLYGSDLITKAPAGFSWEISDERFPTARLRPEGKPDLTILCYGGMVPACIEAAEELFTRDEIACELIIPESLYPFNAWPLRDSIERTGRLLIAEEGQGFSAFGAEAAAQIMELAGASLKKLRRVSAARHAIPSAGELEKAALPDAVSIAAAARRMNDGR